MSGEQRRAVLVVEGRVQGVFFRATALEVAQRIGISGWIRNLADGAVEAVVEGKQSELEEFIEWCHQGPPVARVDEVRVRWAEATGEFRTFRVRH
ncbi:MAG: acylphosphatase [Deltaproteobacteria bacterium]|nr:acylphosphatase [Deltaproteobacteria bacterium]